MNNKPTYFKNPEEFSMDRILKNCPRSLHNSSAIETCLLDFHKLVVTVVKINCKKIETKIITYRNYKSFSNDNCREAL